MYRVKTATTRSDTSGPAYENTSIASRMKTWFNNLLIAGLALTTLVACEQDEDRLTIASTATPPTLTANATSVSLTSATASNEALRLTWTPAQYGFNAPAQYTVQFDKRGGTFEAPATISTGSSTSLSLSGETLNQNLVKLGLAPGNAGQYDVRVVAAINRPGNAANNLVTSTATTLTATPYLVVISYPSLYVPGAYQGWSPPTAPAIASVGSNNVYEGYVYFNTASEFKFTSAQSFSGTNYGAGATGTLNTDGGAGNLSVAAPGYYLLKVDANALTYSATKTDWAIIGAATPNGWGTETPMTFDAATNTWRITLDLKADEFKFRANNAWDINFGDGDSKNSKAADNLLDYGGDNIRVPAAGRYLVTLNLSNAGNYTYTLTKQ